MPSYPGTGTRRTPPQQQPSHVVTANGNGRAVLPCAGHSEVPAEVAQHHQHTLAAGQCCSVLVKTIVAPVDVVWSLVRRFDHPQGYKGFIRTCRIVEGDGSTVGSVRELEVVSELPAQNSRERLEILDDERRVISFRILSGEHRLANYRSVTTVHETAAAQDGPRTVVVESYVVDVPPGNTAEDTCIFANAIIGINHRTLASRARWNAGTATEESGLDYN